MLERHFGANKTLRRLRAGFSGPHVDGFADALDNQGYAHASVIRYVRAAAHLGVFIKRRGGALPYIDERILEAFVRHLPRCRCPESNGGKTGYHASFGVKLFYRYLIRCGVCQAQPSTTKESVEPALVTDFREWFQIHRGVLPPTLRHYTRGAMELLQALGEDVSRWDPPAVRAFLMKRAGECGTETTQKLITSLRAFLRYLSFRGDVRNDLYLAIPAVAHWRLATLPRALSAEELDRLIAACVGNTQARLRDRAIILLLSRLGLRAGDVARIQFADIDWNGGTLQVIGKGRYQVRLPLPQDVGDALLQYVQCRSADSAGGCVFLRTIAPVRPLTAHGISAVVKHALRRAGIEAPAKGAHLLRHTAATEMLRHDVPLDQIGLVLRHRSIDMSAYYAKVDVALLQQIAQPWPEVKAW